MKRYLVLCAFLMIACAKPTTEYVTVPSTTTLPSNDPDLDICLADKQATTDFVIKLLNLVDDQDDTIEQQEQRIAELETEIEKLTGEKPVHFCPPKSKGCNKHMGDN